MNKDLKWNASAPQNILPSWKMESTAWESKNILIKMYIEFEISIVRCSVLIWRLNHRCAKKASLDLLYCFIWRSASVLGCRWGSCPPDAVRYPSSASLALCSSGCESSRGRQTWWDGSWCGCRVQSLSCPRSPPSQETPTWKQQNARNCERFIQHHSFPSPVDTLLPPLYMEISISLILWKSWRTHSPLQM